MYLKTLELHGFKSFPNKTVLTFEPGATVIVGPNGSGKSNISDAMRWVLGELSSRNIRATKLEDVIFGGADTRRPMGFAEVSVTFDNTDKENRLDIDYDEVTVTRRYFRTGESEYLINRQPKRLRDIYDLFLNTGVGREGYSIIGQGKIAEIVSKKSEDRRTIFEEAAGISKYRNSKEASEKKLNQTQDNLDRVNDILTELENQVGPLERDAKKAREGLAIYEEKKSIDVALWLFDTKKIKEDIREAENQAKLSQNELDIIDDLRNELSLREDELHLKLQNTRLESEGLLIKIREAENKLHQLENRSQLAERDFIHSKAVIEDCKLRISELEKNKSALFETKREYIAKTEELGEQLKTLMDTRLEYLAKQQELTLELEKLDKQIDLDFGELNVEENAATDLKIRIDVLKNAISSGISMNSNIDAEIAKYENEGNELKREAERCENAAADFKSKILEKENLIAASSEKCEKLSEKRDELTAKLNAVTLEHDTLTHKAETLQRMVDHFEGYGESVKFVMKEYAYGNIAGSGKIHGPLSTLISVDKKYTTAIEIALGANIQHIVVDNEETAKSAINALKKANAGRATFYPLTAIKPMTETDEIKASKKLRGFVGRADTLVESDKQYRNIIEWLLLRTVVFDNLDNASHAAKELGYKVKIVTLDGQLINAGGSFTGGSTRRDSGILTRAAEISALKDEAKALSEKIQNIKKEIKSIGEEISNADDELKFAEQDRELLLSLSREQFFALDTANANYAANRNIIEKLRSDKENIAGKQSEANEELSKLGFQLSAAEERIAAIREHRAKLSEERGVIDEKTDELGQLANEEFIKVTTTRKDIETFERMANDIDTRCSDIDAEIKSQSDRVSDLERSRANQNIFKIESAKEFERLQEEIETLTKKRTELDVGNEEYDKEIAVLREKIREKNSSRDTFYEAVVKNEAKLERLQRRDEELGSILYDDYELTYEDAVALNYTPVTEENRAEMGALQASCKAKLKRIGNFDPSAIEKYTEVKARYDELAAQYNDLIKSKEELLDIIQKLEEGMKNTFITAFEEINKNFGITFKELFGGGSAELSLSDPENILTSGIEIKVAPPGKIIKTMSLLSGGEQAFVAIALLFAILKVNPTPFCILDEIEAALDEVNVFRFGEYIKRLSEGTQFILITHRRGTMEVGNKLYGVTMPQRGISQVIELNVNDIESKQKELLDGVL